MKRLFSKEAIISTTNIFSFNNAGSRIKKFFRVQYIILVILITIAGAITGLLLGGELGDYWSSEIAESQATNYMERMYTKEVLAKTFSGTYDDYESKNFEIYESRLYNSYKAHSFFLCPILSILGLLISTVLSYFISSIILWLPSILGYGFGKIVENSDYLHYLKNVPQSSIKPVIDKQTKTENNVDKSISVSRNTPLTEKENTKVSQEVIHPSTDYKKDAPSPKQIETYTTNACEKSQEKTPPIIKETVNVKKEMTLEDKLEYALRYTTDEGMIAYLNRIDNDEIQSILNNSQKEQVRSLIHDLLNKS